jgi:outer membrane immunogenic protein
MKKLILSACAFALPTLVQAADLPYRSAPPVFGTAVPVFTWTGFYVGAQAGYAWGDTRNLSVTTRTGRPGGVSENYSPDGAVGGAHAGVNLQFGHLVVGGEVDLEATGIEGQTTRAGRNRTELTADWQGSVRGRVGFAADRFMIYGTAGLAFADIEVHQVNAATRRSESSSDMELGYTIGGGVEYAFTNSLTARLEYRYSEFDTIRKVSTVFPGQTMEQRDPSFHTMRAGVSYKF